MMHGRRFQFSNSKRSITWYQYSNSILHSKMHRNFTNNMTADNNLENKRTYSSIYAILSEMENKPRIRVPIKKSKLH